MIITTDIYSRWHVCAWSGLLLSTVSLVLFYCIVHSTFLSNFPKKNGFSGWHTWYSCFCLKPFYFVHSSPDHICFFCFPLRLFFSFVPFLWAVMMKAPVPLLCWSLDLLCVDDDFTVPIVTLSVVFLSCVPNAWHRTMSVSMIFKIIILIQYHKINIYFNFSF